MFRGNGKLCLLFESLCFQFQQFSNRAIKTEVLGIIQKLKQKMTFFGEQATALLRNTHKQRTPKALSSDEQPRDFANSASGLFIDDNQQPNDQKS